MALLAMLAACACARAQDGVPQAAATTATAPQGPAVASPSQQENLYQDALEALGEGRRTDASKALEQLVDEQPTHAGAWLDLALIQCSLGNADEAERMFAIIETRFNPSRDILELIAETREAGCLPWKPTSALSLTVGRGVDQNVNQGASTSALVLEGGSIVLPLLPDFLPRHDQYSVVGVDYVRDVTPNGSIGFVQLQARHNDSIHEYDSNSLVAGVDFPWKIKRWTLHTVGSLGAVTLGGHYYQRQAQLQARVIPPLPLPGSMQFSMLGSATRTEYMTLTNFDSNTYELRGLFTYRKDSWYASASLGYQDDHTGSGRPGGNRDGWYGNLQVRRALIGPLTGELNYTRQTWNSTTAYSPGLIDVIRSQSTQVLRGTLIWPFAKNQSLQLEGRAIRNHENISIFQYNNKQLQLSWQWQY
jgi:tetratricopeptide (TPR) repeat protein